MNRVYSIDALVSRVHSLRTELPIEHRLIVALAGAPGTGKSTLAKELCDRLPSSVVVPMDGFHLDNAILEERGQLAIKGAPQTFDVNGFSSLMQRLLAPTATPIYVPVFDRAADLARNAAQCVDEHHRVIIVEGNYLLLNRPGWKLLPALFHLSVMLEVPLEILERRLVQRWLDHGLDPVKAQQRALANDIPNAQLVVQESTPADLRYVSVRQ